MSRKLDVGDVLSRVFTIYRDHAGVLLPVAAAIFAVEAVAGGLLIAATPALVVVAILIQVVATTLYAGMVVELVADVQDGRRDQSVGALFAAVTGVLIPLILAGLVVGILVAIGFVLFIVPGLILLTIFAVVAPAVVLERRGVFAAMKRSRELVSGNGLPVFGVIVVVFLLTFGVSIVVESLGRSAGTVGALVAGVIASTLTAPISALAAAVLYFRLREARGEEAQGFSAAGPEAVVPPA